MKIQSENRNLLTTVAISAGLKRPGHAIENTKPLNFGLFKEKRKHKLCKF